MARYEAWICEIDDGDDERRIYSGNDLDEVENAIYLHDEEVAGDVDKYFMVNDMTFSDWEEFKSQEYLIEPRR